MRCEWCPFVGLRYAQALAEPRLDGNDDGARIGIVKCNGQSFALEFLPARYENDQQNKRMWRMPRLSRSIRYILNHCLCKRNAPCSVPAPPARKSRQARKRSERGHARRGRDEHLRAVSLPGRARHAVHDGGVSRCAWCDSSKRLHLWILLPPFGADSSCLPVSRAHHSGREACAPRGNPSARQGPWRIKDLEASRTLKWGPAVMADPRFQVHVSK